MRAVIQRVHSAQVRVEGQVVGEIGAGLVVLLGVAGDDGPADVESIARKVPDLRIFEDDDGKMNRSLVEVGGAILAVSQFTLYGSTKKGRRPEFTEAAGAEFAKNLYEEFVRKATLAGLTVAEGVFQARMEVELVNDGPVTFMMDSK
jgi:D-aminoacyl-tRNA deacylase